jgi:hypothetical protein
MPEEILENCDTCNKPAPNLQIMLKNEPTNYFATIKICTECHGKLVEDELDGYNLKNDTN